MNILIVGYGRLGKTLYSLLSPYTSVGIFKRNNDLKKIENVDVIVLYVPEDSFEEILKLVSERNPDALVVDTSSTKREVLSLLKKYCKNYLSIHPMFGENIYPEFSEVIVVETSNKELSDKFLKLLEKSGMKIKYLDVETHENECRRVQSITHFILLSLYKYLKNTKVKTALSSSIISLAERVLSQNPKVIWSIQKNAYRERQEFIEFLKKMNKLFENEESIKQEFEWRNLDRSFIINASKIFDYPSTLEEARLYLDVIDKLILNLISLRINIGKNVIAREKQKKNKAIYNGEAEKKRLSKLLLYSKKKELNPFWVESLVKLLIQWTKQEEYEFLGIKKTLGILGPEGSFSEEAALKLVKSRTPLIYFKTIEDVFKGVTKGVVDHGLVPIENTTGGTVIQTLECLRKYDVYVCGETKIVINHCLVAKRNFESFEEIKIVYSHPQAILQCSNFIKTYLSHTEIKYASSTSEAIKLLDASSAAISSETAALLNNCIILRKGIQDLKEDNITRFYIISKRSSDQGDVTALFFTVKDEPGSLKRILDVFYNYNINLRKLESHPDKSRPGSYIFFTEAEAKLDENVIKELRQVTVSLRILGVFSEINHLEI